MEFGILIKMEFDAVLGRGATANDGLQMSFLLLNQLQ